MKPGDFSTGQFVHSGLFNVLALFKQNFKRQGV